MLISAVGPEAPQPIPGHSPGEPQALYPPCLPGDHWVCDITATSDLAQPSQLTEKAVSTLQTLPTPHALCYPNPHSPHLLSPNSLRRQCIDPLCWLCHDSGRASVRGAVLPHRARKRKFPVGERLAYFPRKWVTTTRTGSRAVPAMQQQELGLGGWAQSGGKRERGRGSPSL